MRLSGPPKYPAPDNCRAKDRGSILFFTMWTLCLLGIFGVVLASGIRQKLALVYRLDEQQKLGLIAESGIQKAIMWLLQENETRFLALHELWSSNPAFFQDINSGDGASNICYTVRDEFGADIQRYGMIDEERKININTAELGVLKRLFQATGACDTMEAQELAASIVDWRDADSQVSIPLGSAEDMYYSGLSAPYKAKNAPFETLPELLLVKGMSTRLYDQLSPYLTLYSDGMVNINTAPWPVLAAVGLSDGLVEKILEYRRGNDRLEGTPDDYVFDDILKIDLALKKAYPVNDKEVVELAFAVSHYLGVESGNFTVMSNAQLRNKKGVRRLVCVVQRTGKVLSWEES